MAHRTISMDGATWEISPTGRVTQYARDEFGVRFQKRGGTDADQRVARFAPMGSRASEDALAELSDYELRELYQRSQPAWTSPETGYAS
jgi:hypothetical protein